MRFSSIKYFLIEGFSNVFKNKKSTISCVGVMCATMLIFGLFYAIVQNINHMVTEIESAQGMQVFIEPGATDEQIAQLKEDINKIEGVNTIEFISQEVAYNQMKERLGDNQELMTGLEPSIFKPSYLVTLTDLNLNMQVKDSINQLENVASIQNRDKTIQTLSKLGKGIRIVTFVILAILILISVFIISNTIKLTVHARRKEISIMKYIGATNNFIKTPFMIEGVIIGLISGIFSIALVGIGYNLLAQKIMSSTTLAEVGVSLLGFSTLFNEIVIVYIALGVGIGVLGSAISMKKYLEV